MGAQDIFWSVNIKFLRLRQKLSQEALAEKLGISRVKLDAIESGAEEIAGLAKAAGEAAALYRAGAEALHAQRQAAAIRLDAAVARDGGDISIKISGTPGQGTIRIGVIDKGSASKPYVRDAPEDVTGRGLFLVDALSDRWGVHDHECAREVWFELNRGDTRQEDGEPRNRRKF